MELPPSCASAIWGKCSQSSYFSVGFSRLVGFDSELPPSARPGENVQLTSTPAPLCSLDTLPRSRSLLPTNFTHRRGPVSKIPRKNRRLSTVYVIGVTHPSLVISCVMSVFKNAVQIQLIRKFLSSCLLQKISTLRKKVTVTRIRTHPKFRFVR